MERVMRWIGRVGDVVWGFWGEDLVFGSAIFGELGWGWRGRRRCVCFGDVGNGWRAKSC